MAKPKRITSEEAQGKLVDALAAIKATNPDEWHLQTILIMAMFHEHVVGDISHPDHDPEAVEAGTSAIMAINKLAIRHPSDWVARLIRFALLTDIKMNKRDE